MSTTDKPIQLDMPEEFDKLPEERKQYLLKWIEQNLNFTEDFNQNVTSYSLKHMITSDDIEEDTYFTNGEFKGAMLKSGYKVKDTSKKNWVFNVTGKYNSN